MECQPPRRPPAGDVPWAPYSTTRRTPATARDPCAETTGSQPLHAGFGLSWIDESPPYIELNLVTGNSTIESGSCLT